MYAQADDRKWNAQTLEQIASRDVDPHFLSLGAYALQQDLAF